MFLLYGENGRVLAPANRPVARNFADVPNITTFLPCLSLIEFLRAGLGKQKTWPLRKTLCKFPLSGMAKTTVSALGTLAGMTGRSIVHNADAFRVLYAQSVFLTAL